jgi:hypothetical protein
MENNTTRIRQLNDLFRQTFRGGRAVVTRSIASRKDVAEIIDRVRIFDEFSEDSDPYGEHDFGAFDYDGETSFWKIDYFDRSLNVGSPNPADPIVTTRVLTVMLAEED